MDCHHEYIEEDPFTRALVCSTCGLVLNESELVDASFIDTAKRDQFNQGDQVKERFWQQLSLIQSLSVKFSLGPHSVEEAQRMFVDLYRSHGNRLVDRGKKGRLAAATCILLINRQGGSALSVADLAAAVGESLLTLGKYIVLLKRECPGIVMNVEVNDRSSVMERYMCEGVEPVLRTIVVMDRLAVVRLASELAALGHTAWLDVGRNPEQFHLACLLLSLESILNPTGKRKAVLGKPEKVQICDRLGISYRTVLARQGEIERFLLSEAQPLMPWPLSKTNLLASLADVVRLLVAVEVETEPPAFVRAESQRDEMGARVRRAKIRLETQVSGELDEDDLLVEKLLLLGAKEEDITQCTSRIQLYKLINGMESVIGMDSEDEDTNSLRNIH